MKCSSKHTQYFTDMISDLSEIIQRTHFIFKKEGLYVVATDSVQVTHINLEILESFFTEFNVDSERLELGLDLTKLLKIFRCASKMDSFSLTYEDDNQKLKISFLNSYENRRGDFVLNLNDFAFEEQEAPKLNYPIKAQLPSQLLQQLVKNLHAIDDELYISAEKEKIFFQVKGSFSSGEIMLKNNYANSAEELISIDTQEKADQLFSMTYLLPLTRLSNLSPYSTIFIQNGAPILIEIPIHQTDGYLQYFLAPKLIEEN